MAASGKRDRRFFAGQDLRQRTLEGVFKMCDFTGADLRGASLRGAHFLGCNFRDADLRYADLTDAVFTYVNTHDRSYGLCDLSGARLDGAIRTRLRTERVVGLPEDW